MWDYSGVGLIGCIFKGGFIEIVMKSSGNFITGVLQCVISKIVGLLESLVSKCLFRQSLRQLCM